MILDSQQYIVHQDKISKRNDLKQFVETQGHRFMQSTHMSLHL